MSANFSQTIDHFAGRLAAEHATLARAWLERLDALPRTFTGKLMRRQLAALAQGVAQ